MKVTYLQTLVPMVDILNGFNLAQYLGAREEEGWQLATAISMMSHILLIHRGLVQESEASGDGPEQTAEPVGGDAPTDPNFAA